MKKRLLGYVSLLLSVLLCLTACAGSGGGGADGTDPDSQGAGASAGTDPVTLADGLTITEIFSYSGAYVEDGSSAACENICAVRLYNQSAVHYQYLRFSVTTADGSEYMFAASTLFAGERMTVLCEGRATYTAGEILSSTLLNAAVFDEPPTVHLETVEITFTDGFINVKNISEQPLSNVYVYYKSYDENGFFGGITYRVAFGEVLPDAFVQHGSANIHAKTSKVVFVTYDD